MIDALGKSRLIFQTIDANRESLPSAYTEGIISVDGVLVSIDDGDDVECSEGCAGVFIYIDFAYLWHCGVSWDSISDFSFERSFVRLACLHISERTAQHFRQ